MSYRTINVNGTDYEYVIGGSNIHIKGFGDFPVKVHGNPVFYPRSEDDQTGQDTGRRIAGPRTVRALILGQQTPVKVGNDIRLMVNPYRVEIDDVVEYIPYNPSTFYSLADDI